MENKGKQEEKPPRVAEYPVPAEGSLGLLALGITGLEMWRKRRTEMQGNPETKSKKEDGKTDR